MTRIVDELARRGHELHVVTSLPWYREHRIEPGWGGRWVRTERTAWGSVTRVNPFPGPDKANLVRRAVGFAGFSALAGIAALRAGGWLRRADVVLAMSPPLTLGLTGWLAGRFRRAPLVFNIQDVFPDAAVRTGAITNRRIIAAAVVARACQLPPRRRGHRPQRRPATQRGRQDRSPPGRDGARHPELRRHRRDRPGRPAHAVPRELGIGDEPVVLYAGNVGFSQSLDLVSAPPATCPRDVRDQRRRCRSASPGSRRRRSRERSLRRLPADRAARRGARVGRRARGPAPHRARRRERAVEDVLEPRRRAPGGRVDRPRQRDPAPAGRRRGRYRRRARRSRCVRRRDPEPPRRSRTSAAMGAAGRAWAVREASPEAVGAAYERLLTAVATR
jgi:colanic acid biosynthesis glycosyl transferase WcaI